MPRIRLWLAAAVAIALAGPCAAAPLEAYGRLPFVEQVEISPDGALLALMMTDGDARSLVIERTSDQSVVAALRAGKVKVRDIQWAGSAHLLVTTSFTDAPTEIIAPRSEWYTMVDFNVQTMAQKQVMTGVTDSLSVVAGAPMIRTIDGKPYAFVEGVHFVNNVGRISLFKYDPGDGFTTLQDQGFANTVDWVVDAKGQPLAESEFDSNLAHWTLKVHHSDGWRTVKTLDTGIEFPSLLGLGRDDRAVLLSDSEDNQVAARELEPDADDWGQPFATAEDEDFIFDPVADNLIGAHALVGDEDRYSFFDGHDQTLWNATAKAYPGQRVRLVSMSGDHSKLVVLVDSPTDGPAYALVDLGSRRATWLEAVHNGLKAGDIAAVQPMAFKAKDGLALSGYLTLPTGRDPKNLPLVVFPHGGPAARDEPGFDWWAQAMASQGYAVLQVNYRGSDGFGWDFLSAGFGEWGRKMQTDLSDGVRYLAAQGTIDPARVCIVGASYGGYAALAGATLDPGVYRCAVSVAGPAELRTFVAWSKNRTDISAQRYWTRYMGVDGLNDPRLTAISPADQADKATIPILLIHGKDDTVVPFEQSQMMAGALKKAGKPVELVILKDEDHWLSRGETRLQMLQAVMDFLKRNNPPS